MAHKTLIGGTSYDISGGKAMLDGTVYDIASGKALITNIGYEIPFSKGIPLSSVGLLSKVMLNENGSPVEFYVCKHDYESELNGAGRTLLVRKDCYDGRAFSTGSNAFSGSSMDTWLNNTWLKLLDVDIQAAISETKFYSTPNSGSNKVTMIQRSVFLLSVTEFGKTASFAPIEGTTLASEVCNQLKIAYRKGNAYTQWTRTQYAVADTQNYYLSVRGVPKSGRSEDSYGSRPAFTLPGSFALVQNADGTYSQAA